MNFAVNRKGSTTWILLVILVIAIVLSICFYTQKRIIEKDRDNLILEMQSSKQMSTVLDTAQQELESVKQQNAELTQKLTLATDSITNLQKQLSELQNKRSATQKKSAPAPVKKITKKPSTKTTRSKTKR